MSCSVIPLVQLNSVSKVEHRSSVRQSILIDKMKEETKDNSMVLT